MGRVRGSAVWFGRLALLVVAALVFVSPMAGTAVADGTSGGFPPPDSTKQPIVQPYDNSGLITDAKVLASSPWMIML